MLAVLAITIGNRTSLKAQHAHDEAELGRVAFAVSCTPAAQSQFTNAVALLHHMTYPQARAEFARVSATDPKCAMAHWGVAMTLFQPLWPTRPRPDELQRGWDEVQQAMALQPPTAREQSFVRSAAAFFQDPAATDYWARIRRWEEAQDSTYRAFPNDPEAAVFYALAHLATTPGNAITRDHADRAAAILLGVYDRNPEHPGAMHYLVHANDVPGREKDLLEITRKYARVAPRNPHALHMPTHIFTRLGDWDAVVKGNLLAAAAALEQPAGDKEQFVWDEFPHAIEYLIYAKLQQGADDEAALQLQRLLSTPNLEPTFKTAFHLASSQARFALERRAWDEAARLTPRTPPSLAWDKFAWPEAIAQFARGLGAAHIGQVDVATSAADRLAALESAARSSGEELFARNISMLSLELHGWLAHVAGQRDSSVQLLRQAAALEGSTPKHAVTPGPTLPAQELLGDLLLEQQQPAAALDAYRASLQAYPQRFNSLFGAARAAQALGDTSAAREYYRSLVDIAGAGTRPALQEARAFLRG
ncbi:MAG: tetratricopeptide repeat protein [Gemmatimonadaceae bacterium]